MVRYENPVKNPAYIANLSLPGKRTDELTYCFSERSLPANGNTSVFGLFHMQSTQEIYQVFIKETVKNYLDFFHRTHHELSDEDEKNVDIDGFLFEHSLQYVNEHVSNSLAEYQEHSNRAIAFELRKMHFIIGALIGETLYLTIQGKFVRPFLLYPTQSNNPSLPYALIDIAQQEPADDHDGGLFSSIISGSVSIPRSKLVICNSTFLDYVSTDQLKHALTNQPSNEIANYFARHLSRASARSDFAALFIDPWYDSNRSGSVDELPREMRTSHSSIESMLELQKGTSTVLMPGVGKILRTLFMSSVDVITNLLRRIPKNATVPSIVRSIRIPKLSINKKRVCGVALQSFRITRKALLASFHFTRYQLVPFTISLKRRIIVLFRERVWNPFQSLQPNSKALLIVSVLFLILFLQSLIAIRSKRIHDGNVSTQQQKLDQVEQKLNLAEASIIYENDEQTKTLLNEAGTILDAIRTLPDIKGRIDSLRDKQQGLIKKISRTIEIASPIILADVTDKIPSIDSLRFVGDTNPMVLVNTDGLYRIDNKSGSVQQVNTQSKLPTVPCATSLTSDIIYVCGAQNRIFSYHLSSDLLSAIPYTDGGQSFGTIAIFNKRLYVLDPSRGVLTRHDRNGAGFTTGASWINDGSSVKDSKDFAIDGNVYFIMPDSSIAVYNAGKRIKTIPLPSLQPPVQSLSRIKASDETNTLYLVDANAKRILLMDSRTNSLVLAISSPLFENTIQDILVTKSDLYVLAGGKLARIPLEQVKL